MSVVIVHLVSGFLGVGKTTVLKSLIQQKPENEKWALIVNEFGEVGIDSAILSGEGLPIAEIFGGCLCCAAGPQLTTTLVKLIRQEKPDRILIEASGLAHAASVVDELNASPLKQSVEVGAVISVVDVRQFADSNYFRQPLYRDQVNIGDILLGTKIDLADVETLDAFYHLAAKWYPPKKNVAVVLNGHVDINCLSVPLSARPRYRPHLEEQEAGKWQSAGWVFPPEIHFDATRLTTFFEGLSQQVSGLVRAKGIFCVEGSWVCLNWSEGSWGATEIQWRRDNRFELIAPSINENVVLSAIQACMGRTD